MEYMFIIHITLSGCYMFEFKMWISSDDIDLFEQLIQSLP